MRRFILIFLFIPISLCSQNKKSEIIIDDEIKIRLSEESEKQFISDLNLFLALKDTVFTNFEVIEAANYSKYKSIYDELKHIENNESEGDSNFYKPYLSNFIKQSEALYLISISFRGGSVESIKEKARITLLGKSEAGRFKFMLPFDYYTRDWNSHKISNVDFFFRGSIHEEESIEFANHNEYLAELLETPAFPIQYYRCMNLQEVYQLFGIDYHIDINGIKRGCVTIPEQNLFVSGTDKDEYSHDLTHYYFGQSVAKESRNWVAEEGHNINLTDYWGFSTEDNYRFLRKYLNENDVTPLEIFEKNRIMRSPIPTKMPVAGLIMRKIQREQGFAGVMKVVSCGNEDSDFFESINKVAGITKLNFNKIIYTELESL